MFNHDSMMPELQRSEYARRARRCEDSQRLQEMKVESLYPRTNFRNLIGDFLIHIGTQIKVSSKSQRFASRATDGASG